MDHPLNSQTPRRAEAERSLDIAAKLLSARDLVGAKRFAELALSADPSLSDERPDQILAIADVLLSTQKPNLDYYSILQISSSSPSFDLDLKRQFRRLCLLLNPDRNHLPGSDHAYRIVLDAHQVLSDPNRRSIHDNEAKISTGTPANNANVGDANTFWALCPGCCHAHLYSRAYLNKVLRCQVCGKGFDAVELNARPTVVPGTDMYYATWGFFPLGFANPGSSDWKPFVSVSPGSSGGGDGGVSQNEPAAGGPANGPGPGPGTGSGSGRKKKTTARKKVMSGLKNRIFGRGWNSGGGMGLEEMTENDGDVGVGEEKVREEEEAARGININEAAKGVGEDENIEMIIDLDASNDMLGNLHNLPFLKDDGINIQFP